MAAALGLRVTRGYVVGGRRCDEDRVTTIWPDEDPAHSLTFEEDKDGALWCADELEPLQALMAALVGGGKPRKGDIRPADGDMD